MTQPHYIGRSAAIADIRHCIAVASQSQPGWREVWEDALKALTEAPTEADTSLQKVQTTPPDMEAVAWRVKDYADGWILFHNEAPARKSGAARNGALVQALAVIPQGEGGRSTSPITEGGAASGVSQRPAQGAEANQEDGR